MRRATFGTDLRRGDADDPIPALLAVTDQFGNRVDLLVGLRGLDPEAFKRALTVPFQGQTLQMLGREDFIAMKCFAAGPQDLLRRVTRRFGRAATDMLERLLAT